MQTGKIVQVMGPVVDVLFEGQTSRPSRMLWKLTTVGKSVSWKCTAHWK
jgi:F0F1-type ATP synthase beta subunit